MSTTRFARVTAAKIRAYVRRRGLETWEGGEQNWDHGDDEQTAHEQFSNI